VDELIGTRRSIPSFIDDEIKKWEKVIKTPG